MKYQKRKVKAGKFFSRRYLRHLKKRKRVVTGGPVLKHGTTIFFR